MQDFNNAKNLSWKEVRAKLAGRDVPYLVVVWHKSEYSLPNDWKKNAAITRDYYDRRNKETRFSGWKNDMERHFLGALNNAITIDRSASGYIEDRKGGRTAYDKISEIINAYYNILNINNLLKDKFSAPEQKKYYESDYREASASLTEQVRNLLKDDINLESARKTVDWYFDAQNGDLSSMSADKLYETIKHLAYYRNIVKNNNLSFSDFYASYNNLLLKLENTLYDAAFLTTTSGDPKKQFLTKKVAAYPDCEECRTKANAEIVAINSATNNQLKTRLKDLQNEYIATIKRWNEISHSITDSIKNTDISVYQEQVNQRDIIDAMSKDYLEIKNINVHSLASDITKERLNEYLTKRQNVLVALSRLYASKLFDEQTYAAFLDWKKEYDFQ